MKLVNEFVLSTVTFRRGRYQMKKSALHLLFGKACESKAHAQNIFGNPYWIDITFDSNIDFVKRTLFKDNKGSRSLSDRYLQEIECDLNNCMSEVQLHYADFLSYRITEDEAMKKAHTLCLMKVIKAYWNSRGNQALIYRAMQRQKEWGELRCDNAQEFYRQVNWFIRMGLHRGILKSKIQWSA